VRGVDAALSDEGPIGAGPESGDEEDDEDVADGPEARKCESRRGVCGGSRGTRLTVDISTWVKDFTKAHLTPASNTSGSFFVRSEIFKRT
jgi:hypothetical protein